MFDIGFSEILVTAFVSLLVLGPKNIPVAVKAVVSFIYKIRYYYQQITDKFAKEFNTDDLKLDVYNEQVMKKMHNSEDKATRQNKYSD